MVSTRAQVKRRIRNERFDSLSRFLRNRYNFANNYSNLSSLVRGTTSDRRVNIVTRAAYKMSRAMRQFKDKMRRRRLVSGLMSRKVPWGVDRYIASYES